MIGKNGVLLKELVSETGAEVHVLRAEENPRGLEDRIMTLQGSPRVKDAALNWVLARLREYSRKSESDKSVFVCLVPEIAGPLVVGSRGVTVRELSAKSGAEIDVGKEVIKGTKDIAVTLKGRGGDISSAMSRMHSLLQSCADNGKLVARDFAFCKPSKEPVASNDKKVPRIKVDISPSLDSGIPVRIPVSQQEADWLVSDKALHKVKALEGKLSCLVTLEEPFCPPQAPSDEIAQITADSYQCKADACEELLRLLHSHQKDRVCGIVLDAKVSNFVIGAKGSSINSISDLSGSQIKLLRNGDFTNEKFNLMTCSGGIDNQVAAIRMLIAKIDQSAGKTDSSPGKKFLNIKLDRSDLSIVQNRLADLKKKNNDVSIDVKADCVVLAGPANAIPHVVAQLLSLDIGRDSAGSPVSGAEDRHRHAETDADEVDYN